MSEYIQQFQNIVTEGGAISWSLLVGSAFIAALVLKGILKIITGRLRKFTSFSVSGWDDIVLDIIDGLKTAVLFTWIFFLFSQPFIVKSGVHKFFLFFVVVVTIMQLAIWGLYLIKNWRLAVLEKKIQAEPSSAAALGLFYTAIQVVFLATLVLIGLSNLGIDISALVAGLGVGGIAVALAAQNVLGDLLASLSIVFDKPFIVGDFIVTGDQLGTVEHIGIKTTHLRSLSGEQIVVSNKDLLESRIKNYKRMQERRVVVNFGILYSTPADVIEQIPSWVKNIIEQRSLLKFDRCHFSSYGDSSLDFELVFYVQDPDYNKFMDLKQEVLLAILRKFQSNNVEFAFPTRTVHLAPQ